MDMRDTFQRLKRLSEDGASPEPERENARRIMAKFVEKYGDEVSIPQEAAEVSVTVSCRDEYDCDLATHCGLFMGVGVYAVGRTVYAGTKREKFVPDKNKVRFRGPQVAIDGALALRDHHRAKHQKLLEYTSNGYRYGAMPLPPSANVVAAEPFDPSLKGVLESAVRAGKACSMTRALPPGGGPSAT